MKLKIPKLRNLILVAVFLGTMVTGLLIWSAVSVFNYAAQFVNPSSVTEVVTTAGESWAGMPPTLADQCWKQTQNMLNWTTWVDRPLSQNWSVLKQACTEAKPAAEVSL